MKRAKFITFEGPDGSGKTTVSVQVVERLKAQGYPLLLTREPGGIKIAEQIRDVILNPENTTMDPKTEALLYAAGRRQHLVEKILPALHQGTHVISDRFIDSSLVYQGCGRKIGIEAIYDLNMFAIEGYLPDKTIFLNIDAKTGLDRISSRNFLDRLDCESLQFHQNVFDGYQKVIEKYHERMIVIDASKAIDEVVECAYQAVKGILDEQD